MGNHLSEGDWAVIWGIEFERRRGEVNWRSNRCRGVCLVECRSCRRVKTVWPPSDDSRMSMRLPALSAVRANVVGGLIGWLPSGARRLCGDRAEVPSPAHWCARRGDHPGRPRTTQARLAVSAGRHSWHRRVSSNGRHNVLTRRQHTPRKNRGSRLVPPFVSSLVRRGPGAGSAFPPSCSIAFLFPSSFFS